MRQGYENGWLIQADKLVGLNLGADMCAEHEWGIKGIRKSFQMSDGGYGLERRRAHAVPPAFFFTEGKVTVLGESKGKKSAAGFWTTESYLQKRKPEDIFNSRELVFVRGTLWTGWAERDFGAFSTDPKEQKLLRELFDAFQNQDGAIWLGGGGVFKNAGLCLAIASRLAPEVTEGWDKADREREQLTKDAEATGIAERLKAANKRYYALSPSRQKDGSIMFWLNPMEQRENHAAWCSVQDLDDWIAGKGKIPMTEKERKERGKW